MKTHEIATALTLLARLLKSGPNVPLEEFGQTSRKAPDAGEIPVALSTLVALSGIEKAQWLALIKEHNFPIEIRPRDASRDILGKLLNYLEQNADAREKLVSNVQRVRPSPELRRALDILLRT
jgi:hypothetical protein